MGHIYLFSEWYQIFLTYCSAFDVWHWPFIIRTTVFFVTIFRSLTRFSQHSILVLLNNSRLWHVPFPSLILPRWSSICTWKLIGKSRPKSQFSAITSRSDYNWSNWLCEYLLHFQLPNNFTSSLIEKTREEIDSRQMSRINKFPLLSPKSYTSSSRPNSYPGKRNLGGRTNWRRHVMSLDIILANFCTNSNTILQSNVPDPS